MKKFLLATAALAGILTLVGCDDPPGPTSDQRDARAQAQLTQQASVELGMPAITNFTEKRMVKMLEELRDDPKLVTYAYRTDMNGGLHKICPTTAVGYGIPYATEYTNPQRVARRDEIPEVQSNVTLPQADPNGLFPPASAEGTWIICKDPDGKKLDPVYVEPRVIVSPFPQASKD